MIVSLIVAYSIPDRAIGFQGGLPWHLPADLQRFKRTTMGHTLLMGRRTFESLEGRQLPGRRIIVLSKSLQEAPPGADNLAQDLTKGLRLAQFKYKDTEAFIAGGAQVYSVALEDDLVDRMYLTLVETSVPADTYFPQFDHENWELVESEQHEADERNPFGYTFQVLERVSQRLAA